jgi:hypothetical protein
MANSNYLTEIKKEYTIQLVNMLTPSIYEGINSIYGEVKNTAKEGHELKIFQGFLSKIPGWNETIINEEASRIKKVTQNSDILDDLIKAVIQSNVLLLTNTDLSDKQKVLKDFNLNLNYTKFIHNIYIEVAKVFYNYPFLFFDKVPALEYKKNQLKAHKLIKEGIEEAIRKMLPLQLILKKYLGMMSEINDDKYIRPLVGTENNKQYGLSSQYKKDVSSDSPENNQYQKGGIIQSQPPMSLKEIYEQQKASSTIKPLPVPNTDGHLFKQVSEKKTEKTERFNVIIPKTGSAKQSHASETSDAYHKQEAVIEESFSNTANKKSVRKDEGSYKAALSAVNETENSSKSDQKNNMYNNPNQFRGF